MKYSTRPKNARDRSATTKPATVIAKLQQLQGLASASAQPISYLVVDDQQPETSRQLMFNLSTTKTVNPHSVAAVQQEKSQHNISGLSSLFGGILSVLQYQQINTPQPFHPLNFTQHYHHCHLPPIKNRQDLPASHRDAHYVLSVTVRSCREFHNQLSIFAPFFP